MQGYEFGLLVIGREGDTFNAVSDGSRVLARPFFNTVTGSNDAQLVAFPGLLAGAIRVRTASDLIGTEVNYRCALSCLSWMLRHQKIGFYLTLWEADTE